MAGPGSQVSAAGWHSLGPTWWLCIQHLAFSAYSFRQTWACVCSWVLKVLIYFSFPRQPRTETAFLLGLKMSFSYHKVRKVSPFWCSFSPFFFLLAIDRVVQFIDRLFRVINPVIAGLSKPDSLCTSIYLQLSSTVCMCVCRCVCMDMRRPDVDIWFLPKSLLYWI